MVLSGWTRFAAFVVAIGGLTGADGQDDGARWWSHVKILADDALEGRDTGSPGHRQAADYVAKEFAKLGLKPAGSEGYLQPVRLKSRTIDEANCSLTLTRDGADASLMLGEDATISMRIDPAPQLDASLVFAGYGLSIPEADHDDFRDLDVRGKFVVVLNGAPKSIPGPLAAHSQSPGVRAEALRKAGAIGLVTIPNPKHMDIPWDRMALARFLPSMDLADPSMVDNRGLKLGVTINPAHADKLLAGSGHAMAEILDAADNDRPLPRFALAGRLKAVVAVERKDVTSENVVAVWPGSDPKLKDEYVAFTAHLDHLGVGKPIDGDSIYNGAMDNAAGVASLLDVAALLRDSGAKPRRSILFVAVTAEEKGLLGSKFYSLSPTVPNGAIVADVNSDMFLPLYPLKRLTIFGLDESDLGGESAKVAESLGISPESDPEPQRNVFIRSDQYSFIKQGIPSVMFKVGYAKGSPEEATFQAWLKERYHAPSDDLNQPVDKGAAAAFDALMAKLLVRVADNDEKPRWKDASFFKRFAH